MSVALISFGVCAATIVFARVFLHRAHTQEKKVSRSAYIWGAFFTLVELAVGIYASLGLVEENLLATFILLGCLFVCAALSFARDAVARVLGQALGLEGRFAHPLVVGVAMLGVAGLATSLALELPSNQNIFSMYPLCFLLEWFLVTTPLIALFFLFQRRSAASAVWVVALHVLGLAEYFVITFKSMPIQPGDLTALSTAVAVSAGYVYELSAFCLIGMAFCALALLLCQLASVVCVVPHGKKDNTARGRALLNILVGMALLAGVVAHVTLIDYYNTLWIQVYTWRPLTSYYSEGFLPCFISSAQTIIPSQPDDYSTDTAEELIDSYAQDFDEGEGSSEARGLSEAQFEEEQPCVIAIMNETFADLSIYENLHADYQGPVFYKSLQDCLQRGTLYVSAYGGGTANTEFEFLTGNSMAFLGNGIYPYTIYDLSETENLAAQFKALGYSTYAMHPNHATNWNRENVYAQFGFDEFYSIEDFESSEKLRGMVTDRATYDKILELLATDAAPQFIFDVTMQNHSGYDTGLIPADKQVEYFIDNISYPEVNEYLALIQESDEALKYFINKLKYLDRKVIVVFFGDHQPWFPSTYNELWFEDEDEATHAERLWQTDYIIWANYDLAGRDQTSEVEDLSVNYLGATLMNLIGAPMSAYQKAELSLRAQLPAINSTGFQSASGKWHLSSAATDETTGERTLKAREDLRYMQYYMMFGAGSDIFTKMVQSAANETNPNLEPGTTAEG